MANPQPVNMLAALTKERSHEIRVALIKMGHDIDKDDLVDIDAVDLNKLKKQIADDAPPVKYKADSSKKGDEK